VSRDEGFRIADVDVGILDDPKIRALVRSCNGDESLLARSVVAYLAVVMSSWARGERVELIDAAPLWITDLEAINLKLQAVGLLDPESRLPVRSWTSWFEPALERRDILRRKWRRANDRRRDRAVLGQTAGDTATVERENIGGTSASEPSRPSRPSRIPSNEQVPRSGELRPRKDGEPESVREVLNRLSMAVQT
jgi:hypothetical protein